MQMPRTSNPANDRTLNRLIVGAILVLVIGIPLIGAIYAMDQFRGPGPSILERSIASGEDAVRTSPNSIGSRLELAAAYLAAKRYDDAVAQYDEVLKAQPDSRGALIGRGYAAVSLERLDAAAADFRAVVELDKDLEMANVDPQLQAAYYQLGAIALKQGHPQEATEPLGKAIRISRTDADALHLYGVALIQTGDPTSAIDVLRRAVALVPTGWCEPYTQLAAAYTAVSDRDGAQYANGMVAACEHRAADAKAALQPLVAGPLAVDALLGLGMLAEDEGDATTATAMYTQVLATDAQNFSATTGLDRLGTAAGAVAGSPAPTGSPASSENE